MHFSTCAVIVYSVVLGLAFTANAQGNLPQCVLSCLTVASKAAGCSGPEDFACACQISSFMSSTDRCFASTCSAADIQIGQNTVNIGCSNIASTSIPPPFSPPPASSTSLTVTNSETSPPQSSQPPGAPPGSISLAPPTPPPSATTATDSATQPAPDPSVTPAPGTVPTSTSGTPLPSSISSTTNGNVTAANSTIVASTAANTTSKVFTLSSGSSTVPSGTIQSIPTTSSSDALHVTLQGVTLIVLGFAGVWMFL